jgi:N-acetylated-alpha-linked acidic dipeptidase
LELLEPKKFKAKLVEDVVEEDPTSENQEAVPTFLAYAATGDVTAPLLYVNYGTDVKNHEFLECR